MGGPVILLPWIGTALCLLLVHSARAQPPVAPLEECVGNGQYENKLCLATSEFPEWCNCDGRTEISVDARGTLQRVGLTVLPYYFDNSKKGVSVKCSTTLTPTICFCPEDEKKACRQCNASIVGSRSMLCLSVADNHLLATESSPTGPYCNVSRLCRDRCGRETCSGTPPMTFPPQVAPRDPTMATQSNVQTTESPGGGDEIVFVGAGAAGVALLLVLLIGLVICCRRKKETSSKKKEGPYEVVYSTIDDGSMKNGNVIKPPNMFPNELYDARVEGQRPPIPPSRPGMAPHYKSMPSLIAGDYFSSGTRDQYQPYLPHHQPVWTNGPTLHRYPSTDMINPGGYVPYVQDQGVAPGAPYMYLKKKPINKQYQSLSPSAEMRPGEMENFKRLAAEGRPGFKSPTSDTDTWNRDGGDPLLNRDPRSLPTNGTPKEQDEPRQHATYGFEKKKQKPRSSSEKSSYKPVPAKRGIYRSAGSSNSGRDVSSDSEDESYQGGSSEGCPHYFKMAHSPGERPEEAVTIPDQTGSKEVNDGVKEQESKPRRKPKPRSRRRRKRPTVEVTCAMTENPLAAYSTDDTDGTASPGQYTDEDIDEALQKGDPNGSGETQDSDKGSGGSDYLSLER